MPTIAKPITTAASARSRYLRRPPLRRWKAIQSAAPDAATAIAMDSVNQPGWYSMPGCICNAAMPM